MRLLAIAQERTFALENYAIRVTVAPPPPPGGASPQVTFRIRRTPTGRESSVQVANYSQRVDNVFLPEPDKLVAVGEVQGGGGDVISVIDLKASALIDTVWAWQPSRSHRRRYMAYGFRIPPHGLPAFRSAVLLLYDFRLGSEAIPHEESAFPDRKGFILYPEANRAEQRYVLPAEGGAQHVFTSPIAWGANDDRVAVVDAYGGKTYCVIVALAQGPEHPMVTKLPVDPTLLLESTFHGVVPEEFRPLRAVPISKLEFSNHDRALDLESTGSGPFAVKTLRLSLADGSQSVISESSPIQPHVQVPPGMPFIRVGGPVQGEALIHRVEPEYQKAEGEVVLEALIDPEGHVLKTVAVRGPAELVQAAQQAVRQWVYRPTTLNGRRVAVVTTIDVSFHPKR
jgi:hypothetical protein